MDIVTSSVKNLLPKMDKNARRQYPGEHHALLKLPNGRMGFANYMGPGTEIVKRIKKGDPARTPSDKAAQAHDIRYTLNPTNQREADEKMLDTLQNIRNSHADSEFNILLAETAIRAKMLSEDKICINPYGCDEDYVVSEDEKQLLLNKLNELEQEGYGNKAEKDTDVKEEEESKPSTVDTKPTTSVTQKETNLRNGSEQSGTGDDNQNPPPPGSRLKQRLMNTAEEPKPTINNPVNDSTTDKASREESHQDPQSHAIPKKLQAGKGVRKHKSGNALKSNRYYIIRVKRAAKAFGLNASAQRAIIAAAKGVLDVKKVYSNKQTIDRIARKITGLIVSHSSGTNTKSAVKVKVKQILQ